MALLRIPLRSDFGSYQFRIDLDDFVFEIGVRFNGRMDRWIMDILDSEANPILVGIPLLTNTDLHKRFKDANLPLGRMLVYNEDGSDTNSDREALGTDVVLLYEEDAA